MRNRTLTYAKASVDVRIARGIKMAGTIIKRILYVSI